MNISEKQLEDLICEHPETLWDGFTVVGRQVPLPHGILDILGTSGMAIYLIELKVGPIKESHVGQVLRYVHDVNHFVFDTWQRLIDYAIEDAVPPAIGNDILTFFRKVGRGPRTLRMQLFYEHIFPESERMPYCRPMLIGTSIDDSTKAALAGANGYLGLWHYDGNENRLEIKTDFMGGHVNIGRCITASKLAEDVIRRYLLGIEWFIDFCEFDAALEELFKMRVDPPID